MQSSTPMTAESWLLSRSAETTGLDYDGHHVLRATDLRFSLGGRRMFPVRLRPDPEEPRRLLAAVDSVLARRSDDDDVEALEISFVYRDCHDECVFMESRGKAGSHYEYLTRHEHAADVTSAHLARWLRFVERRVTGSFTLAVPTVPPSKSVDEGGDGDNAHVRELIAELPASARATTMSLALGNATLKVPVAGVGAFHALTDLVLRLARIDPSGADEHNLGRMLSSSCCPRLRRLQLEYIVGIATLRLDAADTLEDLRLESLPDMLSVDVNAPGLRELHIFLPEEAAATRVSAPRLEMVSCSGTSDHLPLELAGGASANVRRLQSLGLWSHGHPPGHPEGYINAGVVWLLEQCSAAESLNVNISPPFCEEMGSEEIMSLMPALPNVTDLEIEITMSSGHRFGASVARFIRQCSNVRLLSVDVKDTYYTLCTNPRCFCGSDCEGNVEMSLPHLIEAKVSGVRPVEDHMNLVRRLVTSAPMLERMTVEFESWSPSWKKDRGYRVVVKDDLPACDGARWICLDPVVVWIRLCVFKLDPFDLRYSSIAMVAVLVR
ncbi:uncharacterized protein [Triticum aestivum]|uniref:uncharacterized protein n=1 Tax=Triticum aestivum TaxID=4565 RepID=UPI000843E259|nr:uncharacterized protein LOC123135145 [Triticum aestivum]